MPFPPSVKREVLTKSARHCCVCHRYKGVKVEVHHIVAQSDGGSDDVENAIALCFDCHADAGHYNPDHPKGSRFSPTELRQARDLWFLLVEQNRIEAPVSTTWAYVRYLICKDLSALREICAADLSRLPIPNPRLIENPTLQFLSDLLETVGERYAQLRGTTFSDQSAYALHYGQTRVFSPSAYPYYPYYRAFRTPDLAEIRQQVLPRDPATGVFVDLGVPGDSLCLAMAFDELCGGGQFQEIYKLRDIWTVFLEISNIAEEPVTLRAVEGGLEESTGYRPFTQSAGEVEVQSLPKAPILPGDSVVFPVGVLLAPISRPSPPPIRRSTAWLERAQYQEVDHTDLHSLLHEVGVVGPAFWPEKVEALIGDTLMEQPVHELDLANVYTIDRHWAMGCCPHLFGRDRLGRRRYMREIFTEKPGQRHVFRFEVPSWMQTLIVAELEPEETHLDRILVNGRDRVKGCVLLEGDVVELPVEPFDEVEIWGWYAAPMEGRQHTTFQNRRIVEFLGADI